MRYFVLFLLLVNFASAAIPNPVDQYVNDFAGILDEEQKSFMKGLFELVEQNTTAQIVFVSLDAIEGEIGDYALDIGEEWGVGQEEKDNGVVILYVKDINRIWVATGYGVEGILPDSKIGRFLDENYVPLRKEGQVGEGIVQFSIAIASEMEANSVELISPKKNEINWVWIILAIIIIIIILSTLSKFNKGAPILAFPIPMGSHSNFPNFGGGSFGGGGAGR